MRHGAFLVHIGNVADLQVAILALQSVVAPSSLSSGLAEHVATIMAAASQATPAARIRNLRDVVYHCRLEGDAKNFVGHLNAAYSFVRDVPAVDISHKVDQVVAGMFGPLERRSTDSVVNEPEPTLEDGFDHWAVAAAKSGMTGWRPPRPRTGGAAYSRFWFLREVGGRQQRAAARLRSCFV